MRAVCPFLFVCLAPSALHGTARHGTAQTSAERDFRMRLSALNLYFIVGSLSIFSLFIKKMRSNANAKIKNKKGEEEEEEEEELERRKK